MSKSDLRNYYKNLRKEIAPEKKQLLSSEIVKQITEFILKQKFKSVGIYYPINGEVDLLSIIPWAQENQIAVFAPSVLPNWSMEFRLVTSLDDFAVSGKYGIPEPKSAQGDLPIIVPDLIIVPALAYDKSGYRLGYGQGYYDTFLAKNHACTIGAFFSDFLTDTLPTDDWDVPVDYLVNENALWKI
jgi:5-formyltetrahydrofolate cyclo-ligase